MSSEAHDTKESEEDENEAGAKEQSKEKKDDQNKRIQRENRSIKKS